MKIEEIDRNFALPETVMREGAVLHDVREAPFGIYGLEAPEDSSLPFHRMDPAVAVATSRGVAELNFHTAGGRVRFSTDSPYILLFCETSAPICCMPHMPLTGSQGFDLYAREGDREVFLKAFFPQAELAGATAFSGAYDAPERKMTSYTLNFPLYGTCRRLLIGLSPDAVLAEGERYEDPLPVLFYGSSITQGACASRPGTCYIAELSRRFGFDYRNFGFSGSAKGEDAVVDYMASLPMRAFVSDYDHNAPSSEHLRATLPNLYRKVRAAHPGMPFFCLSSPGATCGLARRDDIFSIYKEARLAGDRNVFFVDGAEMFRGEFSDDCLVDHCHPNDLGFYRMVKTVAEYMKVVFD